jgi:murein DD-endopeptidase MepM/ murein hydrolase activator NlpD
VVNDATYLKQEATSHERKSKCHEGRVRVVWPAPGQNQINERVPALRQGGGQWGDPRGHGSHNGIDSSGYLGVSIVAAAGGTVVDLRPNPSTDYGIQVAIRHSGNVFSVYTHLLRAVVSPGDVVAAGSKIAEMGDTGNTPKGARVHLHFEIRVGSLLPVSAGGQVTSPWTYLSRPPGSVLHRAHWKS